MHKNLHKRLKIFLLFAVVSIPSVGLPASEAPADKTVRVIAERFSFSPSKIKVKAGSTIELVLESDDTTHGFRIHELGVDELIPSRGEIRVRLKDLRKGKYTFECSRPCGAGHDMMRGELIVQ